jgi:hypothetical protein
LIDLSQITTSKTLARIFEIASESFSNIIITSNKQSTPDPKSVQQFHVPHHPCNTKYNGQSTTSAQKAVQSRKVKAETE